MKGTEESKNGRGVGRPREFDISEMLDVVTKAFWDEGYAATSLADLMDATGLKKGSLYAAYGDKHTLFLKCLKAYLGDRFERMARHFKGHGMPISKLERWLGEATRGHVSPPGPCKESNPESAPCGCFAINSMVELGPHDTDVKALLDAHFQSVEDLLTQVIEEGQEAGCVRSGPSRVQARLLLSVAAGLAARARSHDPDDTEQKVRSYLFELLGVVTRA